VDFRIEKPFISNSPILRECSKPDWAKVVIGNSRSIARIFFILVILFYCFLKF
jgi:hypothetical protein